MFWVIIREVSSRHLRAAEYNLYCFTSSQKDTIRGENGIFPSVQTLWFESWGYLQQAEAVPRKILAPRSES